ncbi:hypothetical protein MLD38_035137 [Melastoma candidum]|uniref:Uncharacterized protein n=1 Tax=Melastoma candidum TaxID=119954 RepID=A0ACB9MDG4_9MYRT|nr:hypothetical protein MLD38_035137 [Melastoma candidum]
MKIQCNVCESAEATVLCCADEAALCSPCDLKVHAANKLAGKHQRVPLSSSSSHFPNCDICQEAAGFFFCLEDRALLCRKCDLAIHTANEFVSSHQRFLLTGVKVGPDTSHPSPDAKSSSSHSGQPPSATPPPPADLNKHPPPANANAIPTFIPGKLPISGGSSGGSIAMWPLDEFLPFGDFNHGYYSFMGDGSSKADSGKLGDSDCSSVLRSSEEADYDCLGQVPDNPWAVPQMPSPPTASGLHWPKTLRQRPDAAAAYVPDISGAPDVGYQFYGNRRKSKFQRRS